MELTLIDQELSESKLYRHSRKFGALTGEEIANLVYLQTMSVYMLKMQQDTDHLAKGYAKHTTQYGTYALFRSHATDLYTLCYAVLHPDSDRIELKNTISSKKFRQIADGSLQDSRLNTYMFRLESQLKISNGRYKQWRRYIVNWPNVTKKAQYKIKRAMLMEMARMGSGTVKASELFPIIRKSVSGTPKRNQLDHPSTASSVAGTSAGASVRRYTASKLLGINNIADYWSGNKK